MFRNTPGTIRVFAFNHWTGEPVTGDAENITARYQLDGGDPEPLSALHPTEDGGGYYRFPVSAQETDGTNTLEFLCESTTDSVVVIVPNYNSRLEDPAALLSVYDLVAADRYIDNRQVPWREVLIKRGTGDLETGEVLLIRDLFTLGGVPVNSISKFIATARMPDA